MSSTQKPVKEEMQAILTKIREVKRLAEGLLEDESETVDPKSIKNLVDRYREIRRWIIRYFPEIGNQMSYGDDDILYNMYFNPLTSKFHIELKRSLEKKDVEALLKNLIRTVRLLRAT